VLFNYADTWTDYRSVLFNDAVNWLQNGVI
jgi:hypothetical protein